MAQRIVAPVAPSELERRRDERLAGLGAELGNAAEAARGANSIAALKEQVANIAEAVAFLIEED